MELNKLCRTCLSAAADMQSLYETCATSTHICCAEMLSAFTPLICCKDDGLSAMICHNCVREVNRCHTFRLKCLESDRVLRKHVRRVIGVAATNITVTNEQTESRNEDSIKLEADMEVDSCIFEEVSIKDEFCTSSKKEISATSLQDPLSITETQEDMNQALDIVKHEVDIKIEKDEDINDEVNNAPVNEHESEKTYSCPICNKTYAHKHNVKIHMRTHTGEKPYTCAECDSSFKSRKQLTSHMRIHTEDKPYSCTICKVSFRHLHNLKSHIRTHTGEKPYACTMCDSSFTQPVNLTMHMRTHTGEKPNSCTMCDSSFTQPYNLTMHMRTHAGEKPYPCTVCDSSFKSKRSLTIHQRKHTKQK